MSPITLRIKSKSLPWTKSPTGSALPRPLPPLSHLCLYFPSYFLMLIAPQPHWPSFSTSITPSSVDTSGPLQKLPVHTERSSPSSSYGKPLQPSAQMSPIEETRPCHPAKHTTPSYTALLGHSVLCPSRNTPQPSVTLSIPGDTVVPPHPSPARL